MFCPRFIRDIHILVCTRMDTIMDDSNRSFLLSWSFCGCLKRVEITRLEGKKKKIERERKRERRFGRKLGRKGWDSRAQSNAIRHANEKRDGVSWRQEVRMGQ